MTIAASVACGSRPSSGASSHIVASAAAAVTSDARCERPPTERTTAVCEVPPPAGIAPSNAPPRLAAPVATSSRLASTGGSCGSAKARAAAMLSVKLISAMPRAPGSSAWISAASGQVSAGRPRGIAPTTATPAVCRPNSHDAPMARPTASSGAAECGFQRSSSTSSAKLAPATASVSHDIAGSSCTIAIASRKKPCLSMCTPISLGTWSSTITRPMPALKPVSTGVEMKFATKPRRSSRARISSPPTSAPSVAVATESLPGSPSGTTLPSCAPTRIASVAVELTLSTRELPSSA